MLEGFLLSAPDLKKRLQTGKEVVVFFSRDGNKMTTGFPSSSLSDLEFTLLCCLCNTFRMLLSIRWYCKLSGSCFYLNGGGS